MSALERLDQATAVYMDRKRALVLATAEVGRQNAISRAQAAPPCCPACEEGDHENAATYHAVFACACACNLSKKY